MLQPSRCWIHFRFWYYSSEAASGQAWWVVGIRGETLRCVGNYFSANQYTGQISIPISLLYYGVPQGSVLSPRLFILYTTPLSQIIKNLRIFHMNEVNEWNIFYAVISSTRISSTQSQKRLTIPSTLIKVNIHTSGSVKT